MRRRFISALLAVLLIASFLVMSPQTVSAATFTVVNTSDSGSGSLRQAIIDANANAGPDTITFDTSVFPAGPPATIVLQSPLVLTDTTG